MQNEATEEYIPNEGTQKKNSAKWRKAIYLIKSKR